MRDSPLHGVKAWPKRLARVGFIGGALAGSVFLCPPVVAQNVEDQKAVLQAQIELLHKEAELQAAWRQVRGTPTWSLPHIVSIASLEGHFTARLDWGQGLQRSCAVGDKLQEDLSVEDIGPDHVRVAWQQGRVRRVVSLSFLGGSLGQGQASGVLAGPGLGAGTVAPPEAAAPAGPGWSGWGGWSGWALDPTQQGLNGSPLPGPLLGALPSVKWPALKLPSQRAPSERAAAKTHDALTAGQVIPKSIPNPNPNP